jgi:uncharacterized sodium:solute symporter family permease YidK
LPNGIDLEEMLKSGSRWSLIAWFLAMIGLFVSVFATGLAQASGNVLWGLWISIFWLNITVFVLAFGANNRLTAIYLALRGTRDESRLSDEPWVKELRDKGKKENPTDMKKDSR